MSAGGRVRTGLEVLAARGFAPLRGLAVGLVTHAAAVNADLRSAAELFAAAPGVRLAALFGPEHGFGGGAQDLAGVPDGSDARSGLRVVSLYGDTAAGLRPTPEQLAGLDALVIDLRDVGSRYYTFQATMLYCLEAAAGRGLLAVVLDRPNPLGGVAVEGPTLRPGFESFVGPHPVATRHGLTLGELARLYWTERSLGSGPSPPGRGAHSDPLPPGGGGLGWGGSAFAGCPPHPNPPPPGGREQEVSEPGGSGEAAIPGRGELLVVPCEGWRRDMLFPQTGLPWVLPSPNMPTPDTAIVYPGQCLLEGTNLSEGRGTTRPFELCGAPWVDPCRVSERLAAEELPGVRFRPARFRPTFQKFAGRNCAGVQLHVTDPGAFRPVRTGLAVLAALRAESPERFGWRTEPYEFVADRPAIDLLFGSDRERLALDAGRSPGEVAAAWGAEEDDFRRRRSAALLY